MRRRTRLAIAAVGLAVVAPLAGAFIPRPLLPAAEAVGEMPTRRILVLSNPIHTDIAFPADPDVVARFAFLARDGLPVASPGVDWIIAGWGGREFYLATPTWADLRPYPLFRGLTLDRSIMHMALGGEIDASGDGVTELAVSAAEFDRMLAATLASFAREPDGAVQPIPGRAYGEFDRFYEANGYFNALGGCNTWTGAVLRAGGVRTGVWNPLPQSLDWSVRLFNDVP